MATIVDITYRVWPLSAFDRLRTIEAYGRRLGAVLDTAQRYADTVAEEVAIATGRSAGKGRALMTLGHTLGWGGLVLSIAGLAMLRRPDFKELLFGPFGLGLLMQLPSGALVRAGRRELRPTEAETSTVDKRRPVVLLRAGQGDDDVAFLDDTLRPAFLRFGPLIDSSRQKPTFGVSDPRAELARQMDQAVMLVLAPSHAIAAAEDVGWEIDTIARRRLGHKLLVLMPTAEKQADRRQVEVSRQNTWAELSSKLVSIAGFEGLPDAAPEGLIAVHLTGNGEAVLITGSKRANAAEYERSVDAAIYGMKCHGKW
jgi:hypothetical protein